MLQLINDLRQKSGLKPLKYNKQLNQAARKHSEWQAKHKKLSHFEGLNIKIMNRQTPIVIAESATLKTGHTLKSKKSITAP